MACLVLDTDKYPHDYVLPQEEGYWTMIERMPVDKNICELLTSKLVDLEAHFNANVMFYYGPLQEGLSFPFVNVIENLKTSAPEYSTLYIILTTLGGSAQVVERFVSITRKHYSEVNFIVPDYAYSAGTIWCMSGDNILMDYYSVLGPIDPQVQNKDGKWVPALGYLDKVNELLEKSKDNTLTKAEFLILKDFDLADLRSYEQAKELTITLLKRWLVSYKFKNWTHHETSHDKIGQEVTLTEKEQRAEEIADELGNNRTWKSHGRPINMRTLRTDPKLRLKIDDFEEDPERKRLIREYYSLVVDYIRNNNYASFLHTKEFI